MVPMIDMGLMPSVLALWNEWGLSLLAFLSVVSLTLLARQFWLWRQKKLASQLPPEKPIVVDPETDEPGAFGALTPALAAQIPESTKESRDFQLLLRQAGFYQPSARNTIYAFRFLFLITPLIIAGTCAVLAEKEWTWHILGAGVLAAAILSIIPRLYVFFRKKARYEQIRSGLADTIDMLSMCLTGGLSLLESLEHVAGQLGAYPALAEELRLVKRQAEVSSLKLALEDLTRRVDIPEIRQLVAVLTRGTQLGSQLASSLHTHADHLRTALRQSALARANKAPVKLVLPILFCLAPAALIILTAPALLELRQFFSTEAQGMTGGRGVTFGTNSIVDTIRQLDQHPAIELPTTGPLAPVSD